MPRVKKSASHAGSWYSNEASVLSKQLSNWMDAAEPPPSLAGCNPRCIIAPHAGLSYCGHVGAHAYQQLRSVKGSIKRIFLIGPSHHFYSKRCLLSQSTLYETPLYDIEVDCEVTDQLMGSGSFDLIGLQQEEDEHSLELHTPYIAHVMTGQDFRLVPIVVGNLTYESEAVYGKILSPYLSDPSNFFIFSSDFCHWGSRFRYTLYDANKGAIWESIEAMDRECMSAIQTLNPQSFKDVQDLYENTVCGRHPIGIMLQMIHSSQGHEAFQCLSLSYAQSSKCIRQTDSSVSYAAIVVVAPS